jgi:uncharacterized membrane protein YesL
VIAALRVLRRTLGDAWDATIVLAVINVLWAALSLTIVLLPPALAALFEATHSLARGEAPGVRDFLSAVRRHLLTGWAWALVNVAVWSVIVVNILFYRSRTDLWAAPLQALFLVLAGLWLIAQFYVWPFLFEQTEKTLRRAFRNALFLTFAAPVFSLTLAVLGGLFVLLSAVLVVPLLVITGSFVALLSNHAVIDRLRAYYKVPSADTRNADSA